MGPWGFGLVEGILQSYYLKTGTQVPVLLPDGYPGKKFPKVRALVEVRISMIINILCAPQWRSLRSVFMRMRRI